MEYKYKEIMEHIEVTPEMRERILRKLQNVHSVRSTSRTFQRWIPLAAAACLILVVGVFQLRNGPALLEHEEAESSVEAAMPGETVCRDLEELSSLAGFPIPDITDTIPFPVEETRFSLLWDELAQTVYTGANGQEISLRISVGTEDNSGVYIEYSEENEWRIGGAYITVKGDDGQYALAVWTFDNRTCSLYSDPQQPEDIWRELVISAIF